MKQEFKISIVGGLTFFLLICKSNKSKMTYSYKSKYSTKLLRKFTMDSCKESTTYMVIACYLDVDKKR